jgi:hypothetical protein
MMGMYRENGDVKGSVYIGAVREIEKLRAEVRDAFYAGANLYRRAAGRSRDWPEVLISDLWQDYRASGRPTTNEIPVSTDIGSSDDSSQCKHENVVLNFCGDYCGDCGEIFNDNTGNDV